ncbi:MAG: peptidyl-prolyl cis-trans isomerase SurA [Alphaproteobacteria bacterium]|jgi:peptidyl-prolyl cis-trans isomerase SurA
MKMYKFTLSFALACALFFNGVATAAINQKSTDRVIAVVSGSVITQQDLDQRFELIKRQLRQKIPQEQLKNIYNKTLNDLVNEEVQRQYAAQQGIVVSDSEIDLAIAEIEKRNNMTHGAFFNLANGLVDTAKAKIAASLMRQKIVDKKLRPRVTVSKGEIDRLLANINNGKNNWEKEVYQIFIAHAKGTSNKKMEKHVSNIYNKFQSDEVDFHSLAEAFGEETSSKEGKDGYLGWYGAGELSPALDDALVTLEKGHISKPISTPNGWHILYVANVKKTKEFSSEPITEYKLFKYQVNLLGAQDKQALEDLFNKEIKGMELLGDIEEMTQRHEDNLQNKGSGDLGWIPLEELPEASQKEIEDMDINDFTPVIKEDEILTVYHLSDKRDVLPKQLQIYRNRLQGRIMSNRLELAAKRFVRDLRRQAYVELRL